MHRVPLYLPKSHLSPRYLLIVSETSPAETAFHYVKEMLLNDRPTEAVLEKDSNQSHFWVAGSERTKSQGRLFTRYQPMSKTCMEPSSTFGAQCSLPASQNRTPEDPQPMSRTSRCFGCCKPKTCFASTVDLLMLLCRRLRSRRDD